MATATILGEDARLGDVPGCIRCTDDEGESDGVISFRLANEYSESESVPCECPKGQAAAVLADGGAR